MHDVVVYSREGCHLCDIVKETLERIQNQQVQGLQVRNQADFTWREIDIDTDPELRQKYNEEVPVIFIDGRKAFKYHMDERQFLRVLAKRSGI
jgi:glutaredoxin